MRTGSFINALYDAQSVPAPMVGMGATILMWTDRHAATVVWVSDSGKALEIQRDHATRADSNGMSDAQSYTYAPNPEASRDRYTLRRNGKWIREGSSAKSALSLLLGVRDEHFDYSF